ncbi:Tfp pilus assembly protein FimT/FimU [Aliikangiella sp. G2MR2-5]|uniref:pilus assembly FimT family protein n=1 Tax=Aliikangiella sp. G2MR2-5 TaxID=2788943 RepID=UPI0018AC803E|nr:prepilin-type N-terminal cleavage/methylation domain-containing protein [Aliikangiella sp. G2MR2-5]
MLVFESNSFGNHRGYSLIELVITIVLTSIVVVVFLTLFSSIQRSSVEPVFQIKAAELGQAVLEEISLKNFDENSPAGNARRCNDSGAPSCTSTPGPDSGETRETYDDIDDYHGINQSPPEDALGNPQIGYASYSLSVAVNYAGDDLALPTQSIKRIQVTITAPDNTQYIFSEYKGNY